MVERRDTAGVLFADIVDSSRYFNELGDEVARRTIVECLDLLSRAAESGGGRVVDRIGDEIMCVFPTAAAAAKGGVLLHRAIESARDGGRLPQYLRIRVGFHCGPVLFDAERVFGETVYVARRITTLAKSEQILTTGETLNMLPKNEVLSRVLDHEHLKGMNERVEVVEIVWDFSATTMSLAPGDLPWRRVDSLKVNSGGEEYFVLDSHPTLTIGRGEHCDVIIEHSGISRLHARIELRKRGFFLVDVSTNGTRVTDAGADPVVVRRDEYRLGVRGTIQLSPGEAEAEGPPTLTYSVTQSRPVEGSGCGDS